MAGNDEPLTTLSRGADILELATPMWASILLLASEWRWQPQRLLHSFLASPTEMLEQDALDFASSISDIQHVALRNPLAVFPTEVDMGVLYEVGEFCAEGGFQIR